MPLFANAAKNLMLEALDESVAAGSKFASLHGGFPGLTGANELSGGAPAYARKAVTWNAAAAGSKALAVAAVFDVAAGATVRWIGFWDAVTVGTFLCAVPNGGGALKPFVVDDIATDLLDAPAHGFTNGQTVVVWAGAGTLPTGLVEGTVYYVRDALTNSLALAATSGGAAIDLTAIGSGHLQRLIEETFGAQGTLSVNSVTLSLPI